MIDLAIITIIIVLWWEKVRMKFILNSTCVIGNSLILKIYLKDMQGVSDEELMKVSEEFFRGLKTLN
jgi:hypothetical protein